MPRWTSIPIHRDSIFDRDLDLEFERPVRMFDQNFGMGIHEDDIVPASYSPYYTRGRRLYSRQQSGVAEIKGEGGKWHALLDVQHFSPAELSVRTVEQVLEVEGKHEEKEDAHGVVSRHFCRKYIIPSEFEPESATSGISKDGILTITVDKKPLEKPKPSSRSVPIHTKEEASATMD